MRSWSTYLLALVLLFSSWTVSAQVTGWDAALDRYERICGQCIDLRQRSIAGEAVSAVSVTELLGELASLRNTLQEAAGRMTASQRARFESIRLRYAEAFPGSSAPVSSAILPSLRPPLPSPSDLPSFSLSHVYSRALPMALTAKTSSGVRPVSESFEKSLSVAPRFGAVVFTSMPPIRPGVMARLDFGRAGIYLKGSWLPVSDYSYLCKSDGTTFSGFIWTTGNEHIDAFSFSAGGSYALPVAFPMRLYAGVGYGARSVLWEDVSGRWAQVSDLSFSGLSADAGLLFDIGHLTLMSGISSIAFRTLVLEVGLGFVF